MTKRVQLILLTQTARHKNIIFTRDIYTEEIITPDIYMNLLYI